MPTLQQQLLFRVGSGLASYLIFKQYEPHNISAHFALLVAVPLCLGVYCSAQWGSSLFSTLCIYFGTLVTAVVTYRLSPFHPLASLPGPKISHVSRIWSSKINRDSYQFLYYHDLLQKHGSFVRIGPNHVVTTEASAIPTVLGAKPFRKSDRYITFVPPKETGSILVIVDPHEHADRRRLWDKGMNTQAVQNYKQIIHSRLQELLQMLSQHQEEDLNLSTWLSFFSFDIIGDLAFNGRFNLMEKKQKDGGEEYAEHLKNFKKALFIQDYLMMLTWLRHYICLLPERVMSQALWLRQFARQAMTTRIKEGPKIKDFFYHLLGEDNSNSEADPLPLPVLIREASLIIPAGYESTANALCQAFFYLMTHPVYLRRLRDEVDGNVEDIYADDDSKLHRLPYLNAVINETLRLAPALAGGSHRYLPKGSTNGAGGVMLANTWIPEGTFIQIHTYSMHRNPKYFSPEPDAFRPERWLEKGYNTDHSAFIPFSYGPANCVGKQIALVKLRKTICGLIKTFDFELSPDFDIKKWNQGITEQFTLGKGELIARVQKRI